jgi:N-methylhydantoinase A
LTVQFDLRYAGQSFELPITAAASATPAELREAFETEHERRYGYRDLGQPLELVTIRVSASLPAAAIDLRSADGDRHEAITVGGPALVRLPQSTLVVGHRWSASTDESGTIHLRRTA